MISVRLEWDFGIEFDPPEGFCDKRFGVLRWFMVDRDSGKELGDLEANLCDENFSWLARHIVSDPAKIAVVRQLSYADTSTDFAHLYEGARAAVEGLGFHLVGQLPIGKVRFHHKGDKRESVYDD